MGTIDQNAGQSWPFRDQVLVVDEDAEVLSTCAASLAAVGCLCHTAGGYPSAMEVLDGVPAVTVVVTDLRGQAEDNTEEFVTSLRRMCPGVVVVGAGPRRQSLDFARLGVARFLTRPWTVTQLIGLLSGRIRNCRFCGGALPLRMPFAGERVSEWVCRACGAPYHAVVDQDASPHAFQKIVHAGAGR